MKNSSQDILKFSSIREEKSFQPIGSRFENGRHVVVARKEGRKAEGKRNNGGEREKEKEREGKRADGRHGSGELQ